MDFILNMKFSEWISLIAIIISILSFIKAWKSGKKADNIFIPRIAGQYTRGNNYILHIQDFSASKNLRIDKVMIKPKNKWKYFQIDFSENRLPNQVPPVVELLVTDEYLLDKWKFKIYTNYKVLKFVRPGLFEMPSFGKKILNAFKRKPK